MLEGMTAVVTVRLRAAVRGSDQGGARHASGVAAGGQGGRAGAHRFLGSTKMATRDRPVRLEKAVGALAPGCRSAASRRSAARTRSNHHHWAKLVDCRSNDVDRTELFIVEGDSALGTAKLARNSEFQALLPIRGKILNVQKASIGDMLKKRRVRFDHSGCRRRLRPQLRPRGGPLRQDHLHGRRRFRRRAHPMLAGDVVLPLHAPAGGCRAGLTAVPPLHRFELTNARKGQEKYIYTYSDAEYQRKAAELTKRGLHFKEPQRYKGLGEMDADQLAETTMNPRHRTLRRMTVDDGLIAETTFEMLMGNDVGPRKEFIIDDAHALDAATIDA